MQPLLLASAELLRIAASDFDRGPRTLRLACLLLGDFPQWLGLLATWRLGDFPQQPGLSPHPQWQSTVAAVTAHAHAGG